MGACEISCDSTPQIALLQWPLGLTQEIVVRSTDQKGNQHGSVSVVRSAESQAVRDYRVKGFQGLF